MADQDSRLERTSAIPEPIQKNIETIDQYYREEERKRTSPQSAVERIFFLFGSPGYLFFVLAMVALWLAFNLNAQRFGLTQFDPPPFHWLQGLIALNGLLITIVILIRENRTARLADHRAHLDLQVNLSTEQKAATVIRLLEELRHDLPNVKNRYDPEAEQMKTPADPQAVLDALQAQKERSGVRADESVDAQPDSQ